MKEQFTNAADMARARGINAKRFRARLRARLADHHTPGSWRVVIGSEKHCLMERELAAMEKEDAHRPSR